MEQLFGNSLYDLEKVEGLEVQRRAATSDADLAPKDLALFRKLFTEALEDWDLDPATVTIEGFIEECDEDEVVFIDLTAGGKSYRLIHHMLGGNSHGYVVEMESLKVVAEVNDGGIDYADCGWPEIA